MKQVFSFFLGVLLAGPVMAQETPLETARSFMNTGDWDNAIVVLNSAIRQDPDNIELKKYLVLSYTYKRDFAKALDVVEPLLERNDVDVQTYQAAGNVYRALAMTKDGEKMYKKALKKFPNSGPLYSEYGEMLWDNQDYEAIELWEKGIEADPSYAGNYYNAASYYYFTKDKIWTLVYGEIFVNMENLTERATEVKRMLLSTYKEKLFTEMDEKNDKNKNEFSKAVLNTYDKQASIVSRGITIETLNMIRTRFILDWFSNYAAKFPFKLYDYHQQLIREGMFEAYNQWLFGPVENLSAFDQWSRSNAETYAKFSNFQKGRIFKMPKGQHYK
ncbi:MAG TPA: tetratricopeptide repeat protein [Flavisolibacter sp.]